MSGPASVAGPEPPAPGAVQSSAMRLGRRLQRGCRGGLLLAVLAMAVAGLVMMVIGGTDRGLLLPRALSIAAIGGVAAAWGLLAATVMRRTGLGVFMSLSILLTLAGAVCWSIAVWRAIPRTPIEDLGFYRLAITATLLGAWLAHLGHLLSVPRGRPWPLLSRRVILCSLIAAGAAVLLLMWSRWFQSRTLVLMVVLTLGIAGGLLGLISLGLAAWVRHAQDRRRVESLPKRLTLRLLCPGCGHEQSLPSGVTACGACGLAMIIDVEEPRCQCGYLLYQLRGGTCPECGRAVGAA